MAREQATTIFLLLWLLYRRMVAGKDRRRKATKAQQKFCLIDVEIGERQGAGSFDVQFVRDADGTWWEDHLDWSHALRWTLFNTKAVDPLRIRSLMDHLSRTIDRESWATAPLEILIRKSLSGDEYHAFTFEYILELQREDGFDHLRCYILDKCPHLADLFHKQTGPEIKMPASWFDKRTDGGLNPDKLGKAYRAGRIVGEKRGGRNYYAVDSVIAVYPQYAPSLKTERH